MSALIASVSGLCALEEGTVITDANGVQYTSFSTGRPTTNPNWIAWVRGDGANIHSDQVALPATVGVMSAAAAAESALVGGWQLADKAIARSIGVASNTVLRARARLEANGTIPRKTRRVDEQAQRVADAGHEWRPVVGWEARYEVSDHGAVRNIRTGIVLKPREQTDLNYIMYDLHLDGRRENCYAHRLVARAFIGEPTGPLVRHLDDVKQNNHVINLAYGDKRDNALDAVRNGILPSKAA